MVHCSSPSNTHVRKEWVAAPTGWQLPDSARVSHTSLRSDNTPLSCTPTNSPLSLPKLWNDGKRLHQLFEKFQPRLKRWQFGSEVVGKDVCKLVEECIHLGIGRQQGCASDAP